MNMEFVRKLTIPAEVKEMYPLTGEMARCFEQRDIQLKNILSGKDQRLLLIIGPCSADHPDSVLDYMQRLRRVQELAILVPRQEQAVQALDARLSADREQLAGLNSRRAELSAQLDTLRAGLQFADAAASQAAQQQARQAME